LKRAFWVLCLIAVLAALLPLATPIGAQPAQAQDDPQYFGETGFRISDARFWDYFQKRGGLATFGYPVSRKFTFMGSEVQFFQRRIMQIQPDGGVGQLNLMDSGLMPYTVINGATFPATDEALIARAPQVGSDGYAEAAQAFIDANVPDSFEGLPVGFKQAYFGTVTYDVAYPNGDGDPNWMPGINLEMWGLPTSAPAYDPNNHNFVYQRFQRGILHYDASTGTTQGILLADYLKGIMTGQNLPPDLDAAAKGSKFYHQYNNAAPDGLNRPNDLPGTNMKDAFEKEQPQASSDGGATPVSYPPSGTTGLRYGMQVHYFGQDQGRINAMVRGAGFDWVKQQIRWEFYEPSRGQYDLGSLDEVVNNANAAGINLLFSVVTSPGWARADGRHDGPPDNLNDFGDFVGTLASRYKGRVKAYEIWNEQNFSREWGGGTINAGAYVEMLKVAYTRIKQADPDAIVVSGALTPTGVMDPNVAVDDVWYLDQMYQYQGGIIKQYCDAIGAHATGYNNAPDDWVDVNTVNTPGFKGHPSFYFKRIDQLHDVMARYGDTHQMWITEYHWASAQPPVPAGYEWTTHLSEDQVARFFVRGFQMMKERPWVGAAFVWNLNFRIMADPHTSETAIFGILNPDWSPRAIYSALRDMPK